MVGQGPGQRGPYQPKFQPVPGSGRMLSTRERHVIIGLAQGKTADQIAAELYVHNSTVKLALREVGKRLGLASTERRAVKIVVTCLQRRWLSLEDIPRGNTAPVTSAEQQ